MASRHRTVAAYHPAMGTASDWGTAPAPSAADVVVIGGGIIGCSATYFLARRGVSVVLCEKGRIGGEQSSRNWGFVRQQGRDPAEMPAIIESLRIWRGLGEEIGEDLGFHQGGVLYLADTEKQLHGYETWLEIAKQYQLDTWLLSAQEVKARLPDTEGRWLGGLLTPSDGRAEPRLAAPAIARAARRAGATVLTDCAVRGLETAGGRVGHVVTERGSIKAPIAVCAAGVWSSLFGGSFGVTLPQLKVRASVMRTAPAPLVTRGAIWTGEVAFRRRDDGGYSVAHGADTEHPIVPDTFRFFRAFLKAYQAERDKLKLRLDRRFLNELLTPKRWRLDETTPFEKTRVLDPAPNRSTLAAAETSLRRRFPALRDVEVVETWAGLIDVTPDAVPVISPVGAVPGFYFATGFSGHGFGIGPGAGKMVAEMVTDGPATIDRAPFRLERFGVATAVGPRSI